MRGFMRARTGWRTAASPLVCLGILSGGPWLLNTAAGGGDSAYPRGRVSYDYPTIEIDALSPPLAARLAELRASPPPLGTLVADAQPMTEHLDYPADLEDRSDTWDFADLAAVGRRIVESGWERRLKAREGLKALKVFKQDKVHVVECTQTFKGLPVYHNIAAATRSRYALSGGGLGGIYFHISPLGYIQTVEMVRLRLDGDLDTSPRLRASEALELAGAVGGVPEATGSITVEPIIWVEIVPLGELQEDQPHQTVLAWRVHAGSITTIIRDRDGEVLMVRTVKRSGE